MPFFIKNGWGRKHKREEDQEVDEISQRRMRIDLMRARCVFVYLSFDQDCGVLNMFILFTATLPPVTGTEVVRVDRAPCTSSVNDSPS